MIDDTLAIIEKVKALPYVDADSVGLYGGSDRGLRGHERGQLDRHADGAGDAFLQLRDVLLSDACDSKQAFELFRFARGQTHFDDAVVFVWDLI